MTVCTAGLRVGAARADCALYSYYTMRLYYYANMRLYYYATMLLYYFPQQTCMSAPPVLTACIVRDTPAPMMFISSGEPKHAATAILASPPLACVLF